MSNTTALVADVIFIAFLWSIALYLWWLNR